MVWGVSLFAVTLPCGRRRGASSPTSITPLRRSESSRLRSSGAGILISRAAAPGPPGAGQGPCALPLEHLRALARVGQRIFPLGERLRALEDGLGGRHEPLLRDAGEVR